MIIGHKFFIFSFLLLLIVACSVNSAHGALNQVPTISPTGLTATAVSPTQIDLSWTAPTQNYGKTIVGYKIEQEVGHGIYDTLVYNSGSQLTVYAVTGLKTGVTYTYRVSAVYSDDTSTDPSNPASDTPTTTSSAPMTGISPSAPKNMKLTFVPSDGTALMGVIISSDDYVALQYKKDARSVLLDQSQTTNSINNNVDNLLAYQNKHLTSDSVPAPLMARAMSDTTVLLTWLPPLEQYGQKLMGYKIELKNSLGIYKSVDDNTGNSDTKYYVTGLEPGMTYTYRVFAVYPGTHSNPSNDVTVTTLTSTPPPAPKPDQTTAVPSNTSQPVIPQIVINVRLDFTTPDGTTLQGVIMTQNDYQQLVVIKDPRTMLSNVTQTSSPINNDLAGLIRYQNLHPQIVAVTPAPIVNSSERPPAVVPPQDVAKPADSKLVDGVVTSVVASGVVGIITWFVKTKVARKITKDYHFTLEYVSSDASQIRIRNSGETIEDCVILCDWTPCVWTDTHLDKPRHVYEGSVSVATLPTNHQSNSVIGIKSGKKMLKRIKLDEMAHG